MLPDRPSWHWMEFLPGFVFGVGLTMLSWSAASVTRLRPWSPLLAALFIPVGISLVTWYLCWHGRLESPEAAVVIGACWLVIWGVCDPAVGRPLAGVFAVTATGMGTAFLVWAVTTKGEPGTAPAWGAGLLAAGLTAFVLCLAGRNCQVGDTAAAARPPTPQNPPGP
jgi:hypothetical protein